MANYTRLTAVVCIIAVAALLFACADETLAASAAQINRDADAALKTLLAKSPSAKALSEKAKAVLVFPSITKGGLIVGGQYGEGVLRQGGKTIGYYSSAAASYGLQAGVQTFGYAMFFMNDSALKWLAKSDGWEVGTGPSIVVADKGAAGSMTTSTAQSDIYAFFFSQKGVMAGLGLQGTKITKIAK